MALDRKKEKKQRQQNKKKPAIDPTPDTTRPPRGQTSSDRSSQDARAAALRRDRARVVKGDIPNAGGAGRGQRGTSGVQRLPKSEQPKRGRS